MKHGRRFLARGEAGSHIQARHHRNLTAILAGFIILLSCTVPQESLGKTVDAPAAGEASTGELQTADGRTRTYRIYVPSSYDDATPLPLLLVFHGGFGSGKQVSRQTDFDALAESEGFVAVYPDGATAPGRDVIPTWNAGDCCGYSQLARVDDVAFVSELLDSLEQELAIDENRIYATGMSNGGMFSYRLACELADRIAAVAPVAGSIDLGECDPVRPISILAFHGEADENVPYGGGPVMRTGNIVPAALDLAATWASMNGCSPDPETTVDGDLTRTSYSDCENDVFVTLYSIAGLGHAWPGSTGGALHSGADSPINASETIWSLLSEQRL